MSLIGYINEVLKKGEWEQTYNKYFVDHLRLKEYKKALKVIHKKLFPKRGQANREAFLTLNNMKKLNVLDMIEDHRWSNIFDIINNNTNTEIPKNKEASLAAIGMSIGKGNKLKSIKESLTQLKNKLKGKDKMEKKVEDLREGEQTQKVIQQINNINKAIASFGDLEMYEIDYAIDYYSELRKLYGLDFKGKKIVVVTYDPRKVASASTTRGGKNFSGWTSCMNLRGGQHRYMMPTTIEAGTLTAWLTEPSDQDTLVAPTARLMIKPYFGNKGDIIWKTSRVYGTTSTAFEKTVQEWLDERNKPTDDYYVIDARIYDDADDRFYIPPNTPKDKKNKYRDEAYNIWQKQIDGKSNDAYNSDPKGSEFNKKFDKTLIRAMEIVKQRVEDDGGSRPDYDDWVEEALDYMNFSISNRIEQVMDALGHSTDNDSLYNNDSASDAARDLEDKIDEYNEFTSKKEDLDEDDEDYDDELEELETEYADAIDVIDIAGDVSDARILVDEMENIKSDMESDLEHEYDMMDDDDHDPHNDHEFYNNHQDEVHEVFDRLKAGKSPY